MARYLLTLGTFPVEKTPIRELETSWLRDPNWKNPCFSNLVVGDTAVLGSFGLPICAPLYGEGQV
jgi:hypothetical protein